MLLVFEKGVFFGLFFMENPLVSATIKCLNHGFCHVCAHLSKVNVIFQKMRICVSRPKTCDKIRKKSKKHDFVKKLEKMKLLRKSACWGTFYF